jgi:hypothetical protein
MLCVGAATIAAWAFLVVVLVQVVAFESVVSAFPPASLFDKRPDLPIRVHEWGIDHKRGSVRSTGLQGVALLALPNTQGFLVGYTPVGAHLSHWLKIQREDHALAVLDALLSKGTDESLILLPAIQKRRFAPGRAVLGSLFLLAVAAVQWIGRGDPELTPFFTVFLLLALVFFIRAAVGKTRSVIVRIDDKGAWIGPLDVVANRVSQKSATSATARTRATRRAGGLEVVANGDAVLLALTSFLPDTERWWCCAGPLTAISPR